MSGFSLAPARGASGSSRGAYASQALVETRPYGTPRPRPAITRRRSEFAERVDAVLWPLFVCAALQLPDRGGSPLSHMGLRAWVIFAAPIGVAEVELPLIWAAERRRSAHKRFAFSAFKRKPSAKNQSLIQTRPPTALRDTDRGLASSRCGKETGCSPTGVGGVARCPAGARSAWRRRACTRQRRPRTRSASSSRARSPRRRGACRTRSNQTSAPAPRSQPPSRRRWQRSLRFTPVRRRGTSASRCRGTRRARTSTACSSRCRTAGGPLFAPRSPSDSAPTRWPQSSSTRPKSQRPTTSAASTLRNSWTPWSAPRWRRRTCRIRRRLAASSPASAACATASTPPCRAPPMPATSEGTAAAWPAAEASLRTTTF
mmetsp:Transcript_27422/g.97963  ORF Transcript_27422/g.97963 Transcript_27422/m.97963 type:complete len:373 (-) Transcript_27422:288-1406(-)